MLLALLALVQIAAAQPDTGAVTVGRYGPFVVEREAFEATGTPVMHVPSSWKKTRLIWTSADGLVQAVYEDSGETLQFEVRTRRQAGQPVSCWTGRRLTAYQGRAANARAWIRGSRGLATALKQCGGITDARIAVYQQDYGAAAARFPEANAAFETLATSVFGSLRRCVAQRVVPDMSPLVLTCTRTAGPS